MHIAPVCQHTHQTQRSGGETCQYEGRHSHIHRNNLQTMVLWHSFRASKNLFGASLAYRTRSHIHKNALQTMVFTVFARDKNCLRLLLHIAPVCQHTHQTQRSGGETCQYDGRHSHIHKNTLQTMVFWHSFRASKHIFEASLAYRTGLQAHAPHTTPWWRNMSIRGPALTHPQKHPSKYGVLARFSGEQKSC